MNRRELLLSAAAGAVVTATPGAMAMVQRTRPVRHPGVYVQELPTPHAIASLPTGTALFIGPFSDRLRTGATGYCSNPQAPAGFANAQPLIEQFFDQGGENLVLMQAADLGRGIPDYTGALAWLDRPDAPDFNLLLLSGAGERLAANPAGLGALYRAAASRARNRYAHLLIEAPDAAPDYALWRASLGLNDPDMAAWAPWLRTSDGSLVPPGAAMAGLIAKTDRNEGVWRAPAGVNATLDGVSSRAIAPDQLQAMNVAHINPIRPLNGATTVWGSRTLSDDPEWRYLPVRRLMRWTEASLAQGLTWTVFEANEPALWQAVIRDITEWLTDIWHQGGLAGATPSDAFFVKCGLGETMTALDILENRMIVEIGMAVVRPAEFIILRLEPEVAAN